MVPALVNRPMMWRALDWSRIGVVAIYGPLLERYGWIDAISVALDNQYISIENMPESACPWEGTL